MEEEEVFDLANMNEYDLVSNEDGTVLIQDNCVVIRHKENQGMKLLPLSEEVLQALGLALVIDEDDMKKDPDEEQQPSSAEAVPKIGGSLAKDQGEYSADIVDETTMSAEAEAAEGISIVFTDDEDGDGNTTEQSREKTKHLVWTDDMVNHLLCLYEQHLPLFSRAGGRSQRAVWKAIHARMRTKYRQFNRFNEQHLHAKFKGLQRTYKGAIMYWKENLHRTNWVHFEKMHKLMGKQTVPEEEITPAPMVEEFKSKPDDNLNQYFATAQWKPAWLKLTLDAMQKKLKKYNQGQAFWKEVHEEVTIVSKDFDVVTPECIEKKMFYLKKSYKELQRMPQLKRRKEFADKYFGQRLMALFSKLEESDLEDDDPELCQGPWTANLISRYLDLCYENQYKIATGSLPAALGKLAAELGVRLSHSELVHMYHALRNKYNQLSAAPEDTRPNYYTKLQRLFQVQDGWDRKSTMLLLDLYAKVRDILDESGPRFWSELAERFNRKMLSIFDTMDKKEWPVNALNMFLSAYQRNLNRFENDENPQAIWRDIANAVNTTVRPNFVSPVEAKAKMLEMKDKYGKLMKDPTASQRWPHFKRMSAIFSCHLWSKMNVNILLDAYDENKHRFDTEDPQTVWLDIKNQFNARSNTSAVTETQCKTEMHVLKARYNALKSNVEPSNIFWPFYERMDQVFDKQKQLERAKEKEKAQQLPSLSFSVEVEENDVTMEDESDRYEWSDDRITALLDAYEKHRELFDTKLRKEVWTIIDKELAESDSTYKEGVRGHGGWLQYMKLMNKFMDIKERRCDHDHWPFYERMQKIFEARRGGSKGVSTASVVSRDSIADKLQELLTETPAKSPDKSPLKSPDRKRKRDDSESENNLSSVFSDDAELQSHSTPLTRSKRNAMAAAGSQSWSEVETLQLIEACLQHLEQLQASADSHTPVWNEIKRNIRKKVPKFNKPIPECEEKLSQLKTSFSKNKRFGTKLAAAQRMSQNVFKKMEEYIKAESSTKTKQEPKENGTPNPDPEPKTESEPKTQIDKELQEKILEQLLIQNEYRKKRNELTNAYREQAIAVQKEKVEALNKILEAVNQFCLLHETTNIKKEGKDDTSNKAEDKINDSEDTFKNIEEKINDEDTFNSVEDKTNDSKDTFNNDEDKINDSKDTFNNDEDKINDEDTLNNVEDKIYDDDTLNKAGVKIYDEDTLNNAEDKINDEDTLNNAEDKINDEDTLKDDVADKLKALVESLQEAIND